MPTPFARSMRSLEADRFRGSTVALVPAAILLAAWTAWFVFGRIALYEVTNRARLEVNEADHPIDARVQGRAVAAHLQLGRTVHKDEVLVELDADEERLQRAPSSLCRRADGREGP
jgi:multidrug resistance efflux pump